MIVRCALLCGALCIASTIVASCTPFGAATTTRPTDDGKDAGATGDGGGDAGDASAKTDSGDASSFCAQQTSPVAFCDDFELPNTLTTHWDEVVDDDGSIVVGVPPSASSSSSSASSPSTPGHALHVTISAPNGVRQARLGKKIDVPKGFKHLDMQFRLLVRESSLDYARLGTFWMTGNSFFEAEGVSVFAGSAAILDGDADGANPRFKEAPNVWRLARVSLDEDPIGYRARTVVDDLVVRDVTFDLNGLDRIPRCDLFFGAFTTSETGATIDLWLDDLVVVRTP